MARGERWWDLNQLPGSHWPLWWDSEWRFSDKEAREDTAAVMQAAGRGIVWAHRLDHAPDIGLVEPVLYAERHLSRKAERPLTFEPVYWANHRRQRPPEPEIEPKVEPMPAPMPAPAAPPEPQKSLGVGWWDVVRIGTHEYALVNFMFDCAVVEIPGHSRRVVAADPDWSIEERGALAVFAALRIHDAEAHSGG